MIVDKLVMIAVTDISGVISLKIEDCGNCNIRLRKACEGRNELAEQYFHLACIPLIGLRKIFPVKYLVYRGCKF